MNVTFVIVILTDAFYGHWSSIDQRQSDYRGHCYMKWAESSWPFVRAGLSGIFRPLFLSMSAWTRRGWTNRVLSKRRSQRTPKLTTNSQHHSPLWNRCNYTWWDETPCRLLAIPNGGGSNRNRSYMHAHIRNSPIRRTKTIAYNKTTTEKLYTLGHE